MEKASKKSFKAAVERFRSGKGSLKDIWAVDPADRSARETARLMAEDYRRADSTRSRSIRKLLGAD